jgi:hypothetical protein
MSFSGGLPLTETLQTQFRLWVTPEQKGLPMKKLVLTIATIAAVASAPAEARGVRVRGGAAIAAATAAAIAADAYYNGGYGYYYGGPVAYYGGPGYYGYRGWHAY